MHRYGDEVNERGSDGSNNGNAMPPRPGPDRRVRHYAPFVVQPGSIQDRGGIIDPLIQTVVIYLREPLAPSVVVREDGYVTWEVDRD